MMETCCDVTAVTDHLCPIATPNKSKGGGSGDDNADDDATADHYHNAYGSGSGNDVYDNGHGNGHGNGDLEGQGSSHTRSSRDGVFDNEEERPAANGTGTSAASAAAAATAAKRNYTDTVISATDSEDVCFPGESQEDEESTVQKQPASASRSCFSRRCALITILCLVVLGGIAAGVVIATTGNGDNSTASSSSSAATVADAFDGPDEFDDPDAFDGPDEQQQQQEQQEEQMRDDEMPSEDGGNSGTEDAVDTTTTTTTTTKTTATSPPSPVPVPVPAPVAPIPAPQTCAPLPYLGHDEDDVLTLTRPNKPDRKFQIYTPTNFDFTKPSKVVFMFHGWTRGTFCRGRVFLSTEWRTIADTHNYVLVGVDGLSEGTFESPRSFTFPGSSDGVGLDGTTVTTCQTTYGPDYCYPSCEAQDKCGTRCGWTHCLDDDFQFFIDLVDEVAEKYVCVDRSRVYVYGYSMGGMFSWSLGQDPRTAPLIAGMGTVMGLPMHDYLVGKGTASDLPAIGIYGDQDCSVPPGDGSEVYNEGCNDGGYIYVDAFHQHRLWASDHGCSVGMTHPAQYEYNIPGRDEISCASHCNPADGVPFSVDCRNDAEHGKEPFHLDAVLKFFEDHYNSRTN